MIVGITGTRDGCTPEQAAELAAELEAHIEPGTPCWLLHGDCVGVDDEAGRCWKHLGGLVRVFPPVDERLRAFSPSDATETPATHLARNRAIVQQCDLLIAVPREMEHQERGGTWYTFDYARKHGRNVILILPDGKTLNYEPAET